MAYKVYSQDFKDYILNLYKEEFEEGNISSIHEFTENYSGEIKEEYREDFDKMSYQAFYKWLKKREDLKDMKGEPVQKTKHHNKPAKQEGKEEVKEEEKEEKEINDPEDQEGGEELELEKRVEEVDRIKTENPDSKENQSKSEEVVEKTSSNLGIDSSKIYIGAGILSSLLLIFMIYKKLKSKNNKEVVPDAQQVQRESEYSGERQSAGGFSRYPTPGEL